MVLKCEYCGAELDTKEDEVCPFCGGSYEHNKEYEEKRAREEESKRIIMERRKLNLEQRKNEIEQENIAIERHQSRAHNKRQLGGVVRKTQLIIFIAALIFVISGTFSMFGSMLPMRLMKDNFIDSNVREEMPVADVSNEDITNATTETADVPVTVNFNETATTSKYTIMCDSFEVIDCSPFEPTEGYQYVTFHFILENISDDTLITESTMDCLADGIMCTWQFDDDRKDIPVSINKGIKAAGDVCYEVPINAKAFDIKYGDYVTIHIENTLEK